MKQAVGLLIFLAFIPGFVTLLKGTPVQRKFVYLLIGLLPYIISKLDLDVAIISWAYWPGYVKGMIVSLLDAVAIAVLATLPKPKLGRPLIGMYVLFFLFSSVSLPFSNNIEASLFYLWQLARVIIVFAAVISVASRPAGTRAIVAGLAGGIIFQAFFSIQQKLHGVYQASGTMGHQNLLGLSAHFALLLSFAAMLGGDRRWIIRLGVLGGLVAVALTGSRATTGLALGAVLVLLVLSIVRRSTPVKMQTAGIVVAGMLLAVPLAYNNLSTRFEHAPIDDMNDERAAFERAAKAMWSDHPMGVGANQYVIVANTQGYSARAGVIWNGGSRAANVHNTYLLLGAETGYFGLIGFVALLTAGLVLSWRTAWARPRLSSGELALGGFAVLATVCLHLFYEWVFVTWTVQYLFAINLGIIAGTANQRRSHLAQNGAGKAVQRTARYQRIGELEPVRLQEIAPRQSLGGGAVSGRPYWSPEP